MLEKAFQNHIQFNPTNSNYLCIAFLKQASLIRDIRSTKGPSVRIQGSKGRKERHPPQPHSCHHGCDFLHTHLPLLNKQQQTGSKTEFPDSSFALSRCYKYCTKFSEGNKQSSCQQRNIISKKCILHKSPFECGVKMKLRASLCI